MASTHGHDIFVSLILVYKSNLMLLILLISVVGWLNELGNWITSGADLGFEVRGGGGGGGGARKKIAPSGGRRENFWGISCEKSRFYAKKSYFSNGGGRRENCWGISCEKSRFYAKKSYFFPILGGARAGCAPPWIRPCT